MNIGDRVRVTTKHPNENLFAKERVRLNTYEGVVVRGDKFDPAGTFCLLTGNKDHPVSVIAYTNLVSEEVVGHVKGSPSANRARYITVRTVKGKEHKITVSSTGFVACDCVGFGYRNTCSHSTSAINYLMHNYGVNWTAKVFV